MANGGLETAHPVLVEQHVVMIMERTKLPQIATLDFAFVQHVLLGITRWKPSIAGYQYGQGRLTMLLALLLLDN